MSTLFDTFLDSYENSKNYPTNLVNQRIPRHTLEAYASRLADKSIDLFCDDGLSSLEVYQYGSSFKDAAYKQLRRLQDLDDLLLFQKGKTALSRPTSRLFFISPPHSLERLNVSMNMFNRLLTFYQVMPGFLDFVFSFGSQLEPEDTHFGGCRFQMPLCASVPNGQIAELGRSGLELQVCYHLKSIEPTSPDRSWPWSLRPTTLYHSMDLQKGTATWIFIKGNSLLKDRVASLPDEDDAQLPNHLVRQFIRSLDIHLIACEWTIEHWRWYYNFMMKKLQDTSGRIKTMDVDRVFEKPDLPPPSRVGTLQSNNKSSTEQSSSPLQRIAELSARIKSSSTRTKTEQELRSHNSSSAMSEKYTNSVASSEPEIEEDPSFTFEDIQDIQFYEDHANDAKRALTNNIDIINKLRERYTTLCQGQFLPDNVNGGFARFQSRLEEIVEESRLHLNNMQNFLQLLSERKQLITDMFTYQNVRESKLQARRAECYAQNMENIATVTYDISQKTEKDTITMTIISWVTIIFLPATFISTLMSTDIVKFTTDEVNTKPHMLFSSGALKLFFAVALPLTAFTLLTLMVWRLRTHYIQKRDRAGISPV